MEGSTQGFDTVETCRPIVRLGCFILSILCNWVGLHFLNVFDALNTGVQSVTVSVSICSVYPNSHFFLSFDFDSLDCGYYLSILLDNTFKCKGLVDPRLPIVT